MSPRVRAPLHASLLATVVAAAYLGTAGPARAEALRVVEVGAPAINCVFDADCKITVTDFADHFVLAAATGDAFLQSRTLPPGEGGTAGEGLYAYEYRLDLRKLAGLTALPCIRSLQVEFGPVEALDYDSDGIPDHVYVVATGGIGSVAPGAAERVGNTITFRFDPPVCAGSSPGSGESTFFFGLASRRGPAPLEVRVADTLGGLTDLEARGPDLPKDLPRFLRGDPNLSGGADMADAVSILQFLFLGGEPSSCQEAADVNDNGSIEIADSIALLGHLFLGGPAPSAPFPTCGPDPRPGRLTCERYVVCAEHRCPDPAADSIDFEIVSRTSRFTGEVRIVGRAVNLGGPFDSSAGQQALYLYEEVPGGRPALVARAEFVDLAPGAAVEVGYTRSWYSASPAEGEFPPTYRLLISYDPDIYIDGNEANDDCVPDNNSLERSGTGVNALFD